MVLMMNSALKCFWERGRRAIQIQALRSTVLLFFFPPSPFSPTHTHFCLFVCSSGRLMRERSQSSFSVSYKNMKKTPSLQSLDNLSIDSYLMEDGDTDTYSLLERGRNHTHTQGPGF